MSVKIVDNTWNSVGQPIITSNDYDWMQNGRADDIEAIVASLIGIGYDSTKTYILKGCSRIDDGGVTTISAGYIFGVTKAIGSLAARRFLYYCPSVSFATPSGTNVIIGSVVASNTIPATPFFDGSTHIIHKEYNVVFSLGLVNSSDVNYSDLLTLNSFIDITSNLKTGWSNFGTPYYNISAKIKDNNELILSGVVQSSGPIGIGGSDLMLLTGILIPSKTFQVGVTYQDVSTSVFRVGVLYNSYGIIYFVPASATIDSVNLFLDGISFRIN